MKHSKDNSRAIDIKVLFAIVYFSDARNKMAALDADAAFYSLVWGYTDVAQPIELYTYCATSLIDWLIKDWWGYAIVAQPPYYAKWNQLLLKLMLHRARFIFPGKEMNTTLWFANISNTLQHATHHTMREMTHISQTAQPHTLPLPLHGFVRHSTI